jgi:hypothetical protein
MNTYPFKNHYTEICENIDRETMDALKYVSRDVTKLPPDPYWFAFHAEEKEDTPIRVNKVAPIFGEIEVSRSGITFHDEQFSLYWDDMDHAHITFAWTFDGSFYQGEIWDNEPELIIVEAYEFGDTIEDCQINSFIHKSLIDRPEMSDLKHRIAKAKLASKSPPEKLKCLPTELLAYRSMVEMWPKDILKQIERELGEDCFFDLGSLEIDALVSKRMQIEASDLHNDA